MSLTHLRVAPDLVDQVYGSLRGAIVNGELAPAQRLTQEELAETMAVSRQPVLQALRLLKRDGFVVDAPAKTGAGRGLMVAPLDGGEIARLYQVRSVLDGLAARLAARTRATIDPALLARGRLLAAAADIGALIDADAAFHDAVYAASGNPLIADTTARHWQHMRRAMGAVLRGTHARETMWDEHAAIAAAIARGDEVVAESKAREHCEIAGANLALQLDPAQARAS